MPLVLLDRLGPRLRLHHLQLYFTRLMVRRLMVFLVQYPRQITSIVCLNLAKVWPAPQRKLVVEPLHDLLAELGHENVLLV